MRNTKERAILRFAIIPAKKKGFCIALCFELGLIMEGDDIFKLKARIEKAAWDYFRTVVEDDQLGDDLLNQSLPKKYELLLEKIKAEELRREWEDTVNRMKKIFMWRRTVSQEA
ncbi:hypothetical protein KKI17_02200 [Patescibacteria group bacterium]|nr:hypothetical protein [Patescibacteria group bacterium]